MSSPAHGDEVEVREAGRANVHGEAEHVLHLVHVAGGGRHGDAQPHAFLSDHVAHAGDAAPHIPR
jgi:hypothetical protein